MIVAGKPGAPSGIPQAVAFGSLVELILLQLGTPSAEICDGCNTVNMGSARNCKCCSHKLPAFYARAKGSVNARSEGGAVLRRHSLAIPDRASLMDFAAFAVVINLLVVITAFIPIP